MPMVMIMMYMRMMILVMEVPPEIMMTLTFYMMRMLIEMMMEVPPDCAGEDGHRPK